MLLFEDIYLSTLPPIDDILEDSVLKLVPLLSEVEDEVVYCPEAPKLNISKKP